MACLTRLLPPITPNVVVGGFSRENPHRAPHVGMGAPTISGGKHRKKEERDGIFSAVPLSYYRKKQPPPSPSIHSNEYSC